MSSTAVITGASRGIGRAISLRLAQLGYNVFLMARNEDALKDLAAECERMNAGADYLAGELTDEAYMDRAVQSAAEAFGSIDVLVNNAGAVRREAVQDADTSAWREVMDLNFQAVVYLSRMVLPGMIERKSGCIVNMSSISGRTTAAGNAIYSATKFAINGFSGCLYEDVRDHGIKVSSIMPGFVDTDLISGMGMKSGNMITPDDVADAVQYVLSASPTVCPTEIVLRPQQRP